MILFDVLLHMGKTDVIMEDLKTGEIWTGPAIEMARAFLICKHPHLRRKVVRREFYFYDKKTERRFALTIPGGIPMGVHRAMNVEEDFAEGWLYPHYFAGILLDADLGNNTGTGQGLTE